MPMNLPEVTYPPALDLPLSPISIGLLPSSPIGPIWVAVSLNGLLAVEWGMPQADFTRRVGQLFGRPVVYDEASTAAALRQLAEYLSGKRQEFDLPVDLTGRSAFQQQVLHLTSRVPYGKTTTYRVIALQMGRVNAARAVGRAEATNPIPLVIPCHRVLGSDGSLHGYGGPGGIRLKAWLLELEQTSPVK